MRVEILLVLLENGFKVRGPISNLVISIQLTSGQQNLQKLKNVNYSGPRIQNAFGFWMVECVRILNAVRILNGAVK